MYTPLSVTELEPISIDTSPAAQMFWLNFVREYQPKLEMGKSKLSALPQFAAEIFHRMYYDFDPVFKSAILPGRGSAIAPEHQWAKSLHDALTENDRLQGLAFQCSGNPVAAGLATVDVVKVLLKQLPQPTAPIEDLDELRRQARQAAREGEQTKLEYLQSQGKAAAEAALAYSEALTQELLNQVESAIATAAVMAEETVAAAKQEFEMLGLSWGNEPGNPMQVSFEERLALAKKLERQPRLREILDRAGKLFNTALQKRRKAPTASGYGELVGVTVGADLGRLLPSELGKLSSVSQRLLFYKDFTERSLLEYDLQAPEEKGKGPLVMCVDTSSSMSGAPEMWAKGLAVALARLAAKDNRDMAIIPFSNAPGRTALLKAGERNWDKLLREVIGLRMNGGTNFELPLAEALAVIDRAPGLKQADIVFLTDGEAPVSDRFKRSFQAHQDKQHISLFSVFVGSTFYQSALESISDVAWDVQDLVGGDEFSDLLGSV